MKATSDVPRAVVVGLCAHGLTIVRTLHRSGVRVIALEANRNLPGVRTRCAEVRMVADINGAPLVETLLQLQAELGPGERPVLFLTNDKMVETVGARAHAVAEAYRLSWAGSQETVLPLLRKEHIEARSREAGLNYPRTRLITTLDSLTSESSGLQFPLIVKPTRPISAFKTIVADSPRSLALARSQIAQSMPVIVQEFIAGDDRRIRFGALYLKDGEILARFEGRKLRSRPMGHTTIAVSEPNREIHEISRRFFQGLALSGPVSLELKQGPDGRQWVIEPTLGRTDFWVGLCIANGVNLPLIEYRSEAGGAVDTLVQRDGAMWINGERDPGALLWLVANAPGALLSRRISGVYADTRDLRPLAAAVRRQLQGLPLRAMRKTRKLIFSH